MTLRYSTLQYILVPYTTYIHTYMCIYIYIYTYIYIYICTTKHNMLLL